MTGHNPRGGNLKNDLECKTAVNLVPKFSLLPEKDRLLIDILINNVNIFYYGAGKTLSWYSGGNVEATGF